MQQALKNDVDFIDFFKCGFIFSIYKLINNSFRLVVSPKITTVYFWTLCKRKKRNNIWPSYERSRLVI